MSVLAIGVLLGLLVVLLRTRPQGAGTADMHLSGLVLNTIPAGPTVGDMLHSTGAWARSRLGAL